jgi:hypothetical protein
MAISSHIAANVMGRFNRTAPTQGSPSKSTANEAAGNASAQIKTLSEGVYLERNGDEFSQLFKSTAMSHQNAIKSRHRPAKGQQDLIDPKELADRAKQLWGADGDKKLDALARDATFKLQNGGRSALNQALQNRDPLERLLLLSKMSELIGDDASARQDLEHVTKNLYIHHGDEIKSLSRTVTPFAQLAKIAADAPQELRSLYLEAGRSTGDAVVSALKLAKGLLKKFDTKHFETALRQMNEGVLVELRKSNPTRNATRASIALTNSSAFMTVRKSLSMARELRTRWASKGLRASATDGELACALLEECENGANEPNQMLSNLLGEQDGETVMDDPHLLMDLHHTVNNTPLSWWPESLEGSRFQVLEKMSARIDALNECTLPTKTIQREQKLRRQTIQRLAPNRSPSTSVAA